MSGKPSHRSIKNQIWYFGMFALLSILIASFAAAAIFLQVKRSAVQEQVVDYLLRSLNQQADAVLMGYLLPEQKTGLDLTLKQIQEQEQLSHVLLFEKDPPANYSQCAPLKDPQVCLSQDGDEVAVVKAIRERDVVYGYLLKSKLSENKKFEELVTRAFLLITFVIVAVLLGMLVLLSRFLSRDISASLQQLRDEIARILSEKESPSRRMNSRYQEFADLEASILRLVERHKKVQRQIHLSEIASQVAHDIRSPLTALEMVSKEVQTLSGPHRELFGQAVTRIKDIANNLVSTYRETRENEIDLSKSSSEEAKDCLVSHMIESLLAEKRSQYRGRQVEFSFEPLREAMSAFIHVQEIEFCRVLSNLLNNAVESLENSGLIKVLLTATDDWVEIKVVDSGAGMNPETLKKIGERGFSHNKPNGTGLGIYHAKKIIAEANGEIEFKSSLGKGTEVRLIMPRIPTPMSIVTNLKISSRGPIVILDDDPAIHSAWDERLRGLPLEIHHARNAEEFSAIVGHQKTPFLCLVDYELGTNAETGLQLIENLSIGSQSVLVTGRFAEPLVLGECQRLGVPLLPKSLIPYIDIQ